MSTWLMIAIAWAVLSFPFAIMMGLILRRAARIALEDLDKDWRL